MIEIPYQSRWIRTVKKLAIAVGMALFLVLLGLFSGLGYHVMSIKELSFKSFSQSSFAAANVSCNIIYNPVLFPYYWFRGDGHLYGNFTMMFVPEAFGPGEYGGPQWGMKPQDRLDQYVSELVTWGIAPNLILLLFVTILIEVAGKRSLYLMFFTGTIGFAVASFLGGVVGLFAGAFTVAYTWLRMPKDNFLSRFWRSLWE